MDLLEALFTTNLAISERCSPEMLNLPGAGVSASNNLKTYHLSDGALFITAERTMYFSAGGTALASQH